MKLDQGQQGTASRPGRAEAASSGGPRGILGLSRLILNNLAAKTLSDVIIKSIRLVTIVLAARWLGKSGFGAYSYALALGYMLVQLADLGLQFYLAREISRSPEQAPEWLARTLRSKLPLTAGIALAFIVVGAISPTASERSLMWVLGAALILNSFVELGNYLFRGFQRLVYEARINLLNVGLGSVLGLIAIRQGWGPIGLAYGWLIGAASAALMTAWIIHSRFVPASSWIRLEMKEPFSALRQSLPIGTATLLSILYFRIDILFLQRFWNPETVGLYAVAFRVVESFMFLPAIFLAALFPAFTDLARRDPSALPRLLRTSLLWLLTISSSVGLVLWILAEPIIRLAFGESYLPSVGPFRILIPGLVLIFLNYGLTHFLIALDRARVNAVLAGVCLLVNAGGNWLWIPRYGMTAAAATTVITEAVLFVFAFIYVRSTTTRLASRSHA